MAGDTATTVEQDQEARWVDSIIAETTGKAATTIGLVSGSQYSIDGQLLENLISRIARALDSSSDSKRLLVVKLDVFRSQNLERAPDQPATIPVAMRSPLGPWSEVTIPMPVGSRASWSLEQVPTWLPVWKQAFDMVLVDLGPADLVPSRLIGRLCDRCYLILGPATSASAHWIKKNLDWHEYSGSSIRGTLVATRQRAA